MWRLDRHCYNICRNVDYCLLPRAHIVHEPHGYQTATADDPLAANRRPYTELYPSCGDWTADAVPICHRCVSGLLSNPKPY